MPSNLVGLFALCDAATSIKATRNDGGGGVNDSYDHSKSNDGNRDTGGDAAQSSNSTVAPPSTEKKSQSSLSNERSFEPNEKKRPWNNSKETSESKSTKRTRVDNRPTFPVILMAILTQPRNEEIIAFLADDRSFVIVDSQRLKREVLPLHFAESVSRCKETCEVDCTRHLPPLYRFRALLTMWGFETVRDPARPHQQNVYRHANFMKGNWEACIRMKPPRNVDVAGTKSERTYTPATNKGLTISSTTSFNSNGITEQQNTLEEALRVSKARLVTSNTSSHGNGSIRRRGSGSSLLSSLVSPEQRRKHCSQQLAYHRRIFFENQLRWLRPDLGQRHREFRGQTRENSAYPPQKTLPLFRHPPAKGFTAWPSALPSLSSTLTPPSSWPRSNVSDTEMGTATVTVVSAAIKALRWKRPPAA